MQLEMCYATKANKPQALHNVHDNSCDVLLFGTSLLSSYCTHAEEGQTPPRLEKGDRQTDKTRI